MTEALRSPRVYRFGVFEFDPAAGELRKQGMKIKLQGQPIEILAMLLDRPGEVISREEIQRQLWPDGTKVEFEHSLNAAVKRLRDALDDSADAPRYIETLARRGYRFIYALDGWPSGAADIRADAHKKVDEAADSKFAIAIVALTVLLIVVGGYALYRHDKHWPVQMEDLQFTRITENGRTSIAGLSPDGRYIAYASAEPTGNSLTVREIATKSDLQLLPPQKSAIRGLTFTPDGNYIDFLVGEPNNPWDTSLFQIPSLGGQSRLLMKRVGSPVGFSPDGRQFAFTRGVPEQKFLELRIANADGSADRLLATLPDAFYAMQQAPAWLPDGETVVVAFCTLAEQQRWFVDVVDVASGKHHKLYSADVGMGIFGRPVWLTETHSIALLLFDGTGRSQLSTISYPGGEVRRLTNDLSNYQTLDASADAHTFTMVQRSFKSSIWAVPTSRESAARETTPPGLVAMEVALLPRGKIVAAALGVSIDIWIMNADGNARVRLGDNLRGEMVTPCGESIVFLAGQQGKVEITRVSMDGANRTVLATGGDLWAPVCSVDGQFLYYQHASAPARIVRAPTGGGPEVEIAKLRGTGSAGGRMSLSPDGRYLAYRFTESVPNSAVKVAAISVERGTVAFEMPIEPDASIRWSSDGKALQFVRTTGNSANIWEQPLSGEDATQVTHFAEAKIFDFDRSPDGSTFYIARGEVTSDVVLIRRLR